MVVSVYFFWQQDPSFTLLFQNVYKKLWERLLGNQNNVVLFMNERNVFLQMKLKQQGEKKNWWRGSGDVDVDDDDGG